jgi:uncharacterized membrane protein YbhN (UPF0104 family)
MSNSTKVKKTYNILLRILILVATYGFIYIKVFHEKNLDQWLPVFRDLIYKKEVHLIIGLVVLMMFVNWGIESVKWRRLISKIESISFLRSCQGVLTGVSISFFTPNRIGEFFGRAYVLEKASHIEGILVTILGSLSQLLITILAGTISLILFNPMSFYDIPILTGYLYYSLVALIIVLDLILLFLFFHVSFLSALRERLFRTRMRKLRKFFGVFSLFRRRDLGIVLLLSTIRYVVFSLQYYILLRVFSVPVSFYDGLLIISLIFFILTVFPTIALTELGVRDATAVYFFGLYFSRLGIMDDSIQVGVLCASTFLWFLNIVIPAVVGTVFVYRLRFFRKNI